MEDCRCGFGDETVTWNVVSRFSGNFEAGDVLRTKEAGAVAGDIDKVWNSRCGGEGESALVSQC